MPIDTAGWEWIIASNGRVMFDPLGTLTFARGTSPEQMFEAFGLDARSAVPLSPREADASPWPLPGDPLDVLRVGEVGEWVVGIEPGNVRATVENVDRTLGVSCSDLFNISFVTIKGLVPFTYFRGGTHRVAGILGELGAGGPEADLFDAAFDAAGLARPNLEIDWSRYVVTALAVFSQEVGFSLPAEVYHARLPTTAKRLG